MKVYNLRLSPAEIQALKDRAQVEKIKPSILARRVINHYLQQPIKKPPAA
jgi:hypothetical protein